MPDSQPETSGDYVPTVDAVGLDATVEAMNALEARYENGGWLSNLVWNTRNEYLAWPSSTFSAGRVRMIVEGFLAEIAALKRAQNGADDASDAEVSQP